MAQTTVLTLNGRNYTASQMAGTTNVPPNWIGIGTSNTTATVADVQLTTPYNARVNTNPCTATANTFSVVQAITANSVASIGEAGVFYGLTGATNMVLHSSFDYITLQANDSIQITATINYN
jgi:hypothetical protein